MDSHESYVFVCRAVMTVSATATVTGNSSQARHTELHKRSAQTKSNPEVINA